MAQKSRRFILCAFIFAVLVALDQGTKQLAVRFLMGKPPFVIWDGVFELLYSENRGAAFGMFQGMQGVFSAVAVAVFAVILYMLWKLPRERKYRPMIGCAVFIAAGAAGNLIDRVANGYVVDFFYFKWIDFPVFNVADCYVTVSTALLFILFCFGYYTEEDMKVLSPGKKEPRIEK